MQGLTPISCAALKAKMLPQLPEYGFIAAEHEAAK